MTLKPVCLLPARLPSCPPASAETLANISHRLPHVNAERTRAILLADMPAPNTKNRMWNDYANGHSPERQQAMQIMMDAGMEKYDAHVQDIDAGVLSLRDYLFSQFATLYVTCQVSLRRGHRCMHSHDLPLRLHALPALACCWIAGQPRGRLPLVLP